MDFYVWHMAGAKELWSDDYRGGGWGYGSAGVCFGDGFGWGGDSYGNGDGHDY
jgi:hypothetical protein